MARVNYFYYGKKTDKQKYPKDGFLRERTYDVPDGCVSVLVYNKILGVDEVKKHDLVDMNSKYKVLTIKRVAVGITQRELARMTGISVRTIQGWELNGMSGATLSKAYLVAKTLGCGIEELLDEEDKNEVDQVL